MAPGTMNALVTALLTWITAHTSYPMPDRLPAVAVVPHAYLEQLACGEKCPALGVYPDGNVVYIDAELQIETNVCARSVLLHELVHYLQQGHPKFAHMTPCARERAKEEEAYAIQNAYLAEIGSQERAVFYDSEFDCAR